MGNNKNEITKNGWKNEDGWKLLQGVYMQHEFDQITEQGMDYYFDEIEQKHEDNDMPLFNIYYKPLK